MHISLDIEIERPVSALKDLFKSQSRARLWMRGHDADIRLHGDGTAPGHWIEMTQRAGNLTVQALAVLVEYDWPDRVVFSTQAAGTAALVVNRFFASDQESTLWQLDKHYQFSGLTRLAAPFLRNRIRQTDWAGMQEIKAIAEAG